MTKLLLIAAFGALGDLARYALAGWVQRWGGAGFPWGALAVNLAGFGANSVVHTSNILRLSADLPLVIEIVDTLEKVQDFLPTLHGLIAEGLVTLETVRVFAYRHNRGRKA
ncbi:MAG: DUF190 domain-containing protein [Thermodesulfobacteriota bacterium]